jgi:hypothetical protein
VAGPFQEKSSGTAMDRRHLPKSSERRISKRAGAPLEASSSRFSSTPGRSEIADVFFDEIGNIVVSDEKQVERHVLAEAEKLIFGSREFQAAADQQVG